MKKNINAPTQFIIDDFAEEKLSGKELELIKVLDEEPATDNKTNENLNVDVYNALNLYNEELGEQYEKEGYNPFEKDFKLTKEFVEDVLETKNNKKEVHPAPFLEFGNKTVTSHFKNAVANNTALIEKLQFQIDNKNFDMETYRQIRNVIIFLKNRNQLLKSNINKLKGKNANALQMYISLFELDKELSELLEDSFSNQFDLNAITDQFVILCAKRAKEKQLKLNKEKNKAKNKNQEDILLRPHGPDVKGPDLSDLILDNINNVAQVNIDQMAETAGQIIGAAVDAGKELIENIAEGVSDVVDTIKDLGDGMEL